jgi:hypothetical protein
MINNPLFFSQMAQNPMVGAMSSPMAPQTNYLPPDAEQEITTQEILANMPAAQQAPRQGAGGILSSIIQNPDAADMLANFGIGMLSGKDLRSGLAMGFQNANDAYSKGQERKLQARKLSLEELKANKPQLQASGVPGYLTAIYPDGRVEQIVNDEAVKAYQDQQERVDARADARFANQLELQDRRLAAQQAAAEKKNAKLNSALQKAEDSDIEAIQTAGGTVQDMQPIINNLETGALNLGALSNAYSKSRNFFGKSTPESQAYAELERTIQRVTNESLRLNKGVQTEGDAQRAAKEVVAAFAKNDTKLMLASLKQLQEINARAVSNKQALIDRRRMSQGVEPLYGTTEQAPPAAPMAPAPAAVPAPAPTAAPAPAAPAAKPAPAANISAQAKAAFGAYEPNKYEYRINNGVLQRRKK